MQARIREQIDGLIGALPSKELGRTALRSAVQLGREEPELLAGLVNEVMTTLPGGGAFLDVLLSFLPEEAWPKLLVTAVEKLMWDTENEAAAQIIRAGGFQFPAALRPHLEAIFQLDRRGQYSFEAAFHDARLEDVRFLLKRATEGDEEERAFACRALLETRLPEALEFVRAQKQASASALLTVGFEETDRGFTRRYPEFPLHIAFPAEYLNRLPAQAAQRELGILHPTFAPAPPDAATHRLGGSTGIDCGICGRVVPRLVLLDPVPKGMGVTGLTRLELCACLSCLGWEREIIHYRHPRGVAEAMAEAGRGAPRSERSRPRLEPSTLAETPVALVDRGPRARFQDWTSRENLHRVGGHPIWVEEASYPACPDCGARSSFLLELDSDLLTTGEEAWLWGLGGLCYVFWCDRCRVSSTFWQCA